ncbi:hypothetical protein Ae201684P_019954 [Aphanomyces euteiches]|nr:hypothetical protein Ae201684P_019954 [Aphanomyces euteiches]
MTAVGPLFPSSDHLPRPVAKHDRLKAAFGAIYVIMSVAFSFQFVLIMEDSATNDYYWPGFNTSGIQAFLSDMYNRQQSTLSAVEQLDQTMAIYKDYSGSNTFVGVNPSKGRSVLLGNISLELAIIAVRVRSDMLHFEKLGIDWDIMLVMGGLPPTPSIDLCQSRF